MILSSVLSGSNIDAVPEIDGVLRERLLLAEE